MKTSEIEERDKSSLIRILLDLKVRPLCLEQHFTANENILSSRPLVNALNDLVSSVISVVLSGPMLRSKASNIKRLISYSFVRIMHHRN